MIQSRIFSLSSVVRTGFRPRWLVRSLTLPVFRFCSDSRYTVHLLTECALAIPSASWVPHTLLPVTRVLHCVAFYHLLLLLYLLCQLLVPFLTIAIGDAANDILLGCPFLNNSRINAVLPTLKKTVASGVSIIVCTSAPESYRPEPQDVISKSISLLIGNGIQVNYSMRDASALRFESPDTAGELLDLWKKENEPEQMCVELFV